MPPLFYHNIILYAIHFLFFCSIIYSLQVFWTTSKNPAVFCSEHSGAGLFHYQSIGFIVGIILGFTLTRFVALHDAVFSTAPVIHDAL
ncbi:hypothetical protein SUBVAR_06005 [Subdoligranulum variabile DSM 15176]|uniref:Uncharacterized protein n=1 Tax=Subdoligranulum variabile DSM 15176 TaxID=411471 RepID=D1PNT4_9FIRM|nr:hypothetical protein SUBVAR_06005 [Subdoligranulum variabile DSM 15176]